MKVLKVLFLSSYNDSTNINKAYQTEISRKWFSVWKGFLRTFLYFFFYMSLGIQCTSFHTQTLILTLKRILMICINVKIQHLLSLILIIMCYFTRFFVVVELIFQIVFWLHFCVLHVVFKPYLLQRLIFFLHRDVFIFFAMNVNPI